MLMSLNDVDVYVDVVDVDVDSNLGFCGYLKLL